MPNPAASGLSATFVRLGPFYRLQRRLGLLSDTDLAAGKRAIIFVALAWVPVLLLSTLTHLGVGLQSTRSMFEDFSAYAFAIAIGCFVLMEQTSERRMASLIGQLQQGGIIPPEGQDAFASTLATMERRTGWALVEALILIAAYVLTYGWIVRNATSLEGGTWIAQVVDGTARLTLAGWWTALVALPLFFFLWGRWLWRFVTWGFMLWGIAHCRLRLVATHPDRCGGIAFMGHYPKTYGLFVFAQSAVVSSTVLKHIMYGGLTLASFKYALAVVVVFFVVAFVLPLLVFTPLLHELKRSGLRQYGLLASQHNLAFHSKWVDASPKPSGAGLLGEPDPSSLADFAAGYDLVKQMRPIPVTKESVLPILMAAVLPMACVAATQVPVVKILQVVKSMIPF